MLWLSEGLIIDFACKPLRQLAAATKQDLQCTIVSLEQKERYLLASYRYQPYEDTWHG